MALKIRALLLAAGNGSRFGADKLRARLPDGVPVAVAAGRNLLAAGCDVLAVVRDRGSGVAPLLAAEGLDLAVCPDAAEGMGRSLACGVRASACADGWLVALADMPFIRPASIAAVLSALHAGAELATPMFDGRRGHPVGFAACWRDQLSALAGDEGARALLAAQSGRTFRIPLDDPGIVRDVDRPDDLPGWRG